MEYTIRNWMTGEPIYTAILDCPEDTPDNRLKGLAAEQAVSNGVDLSFADLTDADLRYVDLRYAKLTFAKLSNAKLTGAVFGELPDGLAIKDIHKAVYSAITAEGNSLDMDEWHTCETTHCRAGWVVHLAGKAGKELEARVDTSAAAAIIYMVSDPELERIPSFYCDNEAAMADIERLAGVAR